MNGPSGLTIAGQPGAGADRVIRPMPFQMPQQRVDPNEAENERARRRILDSNGRALDYASKVDLLPNDKMEIQQMQNDFIDQQADYLYSKKNVSKDPEAYKTSVKGRQDIYDAISMRQQQRKIYDATKAAIAKTPELYQDDALQKLEEYANKPASERGRDPGIQQIPEGDIYKLMRDFRPAGKAVAGYERKNADGTMTRVSPSTAFNADAARKQAHDVVAQQMGNKNVRLLRTYALHNVVAKIYPDWQTMEPAKVAKLIDQASEDMLFTDWERQYEPTLPKETTIKDPSSAGASIGYDEAVKQGYVSTNVPINVGATGRAMNKQTGQTVKSTQVHSTTGDAMSVPANAKTKTQIPAGAEMINLKTGEKITNAGTSQFIPGSVWVGSINGKYDKWAIGSSVAKENMPENVQMSVRTDAAGNPSGFTFSTDPTKEYKETNDVAIPLKYVESNFRKAGLTLDWTNESLQRQKKNAEKTATPSAPQNNGGTRSDGTKKGVGYLGVLKRPDGKVSTEISVGVNINGKETEIPTLVPTLTKDEIKTMLALKDGEKPPKAIVEKAIAHAKKRIAEGKSVWADTEVTGKASKWESAKRK